MSVETTLAASILAHFSVKSIDSGNWDECADRADPKSLEVSLTEATARAALSMSAFKTLISCWDILADTTTLRLTRGLVDEFGGMGALDWLDMLGWEIGVVFSFVGSITTKEMNLKWTDIQSDFCPRVIRIDGLHGNIGRSMRTLDHRSGFCTPGKYHWQELS